MPFACIEHQNLMSLTNLMNAKMNAPLGFAISQLFSIAMGNARVKVQGLGKTRIQAITKIITTP